MWVSGGGAAGLIPCDSGAMVDDAARPGDAAAPGGDAPGSEAQVAESPRTVTSLELFFDLVFVFALTEVTTLLAQEISVANYVRGISVLIAVWWAWAGFSWLTNARNAETEWRRLAIVCTMAAMLIVAIAIPQAYGDDAMVFAIAYGVVTVLYMVTYVLSVRDDPEMLRAVRRFGVGLFPTPILFIVAAAVGPGALRTALIIIGLVIAYAAPYVAGVDGWSVEPAHFSERYGLIIIIALGESMVSIGIGAAEERIGWQLVIGVVLGVFILAAMWWMYFDVVSKVAEQRLSQVSGPERNAMARDSYTYLHLPMVIGIVFLALGLKEALAAPDEPLHLSQQQRAIPPARHAGDDELHVRVLPAASTTSVVVRARVKKRARERRAVRPPQQRKVRASWAAPQLSCLPDLGGKQLAHKAVWAAWALQRGGGCYKRGVQLERAHDMYSGGRGGRSCCCCCRVG